MAWPLAPTVPVPSCVPSWCRPRSGSCRRSRSRWAGASVLGLAAVTVAVKVTDWPEVEGLGDEVRRHRRVGVLGAARCR